MTIFPEPVNLGGVVLRPLRIGGPTRQNPMIIEKALHSGNYFLATQTAFREIERILDLLSIVSSRGFKIHRIRPSAKVRKGLGLTRRKSLKERMVRCLQERLSPKPIIEGKWDSGGKLTTSLRPYREHIAVSKAEGYFEENVVLTTDFPSPRADVEIGMLRIEEFRRRLEEAQKNFQRMTNKEELHSAARLYRTSLQMNETLARFVLMWTALESATLVSKKQRGRGKIEKMTLQLDNVPGIREKKNLKRIVERLNRARNRIVHNPQFAIRKAFRESLTTMLIQLDWILHNHLLYLFGLPLLPEISSPFQT